MPKQKILILMEWYLPGRNSGGPVKSIESLVYYLKDDFDIYILTTDTDLGLDTPYSTLETSKWLKRDDGSFVYYLARQKLSFYAVKKAIESVTFDYIHLNSLYSFWFSIFPLYLKRRKKIKGHIVLSVRGMLSEGALNIKPFKKRFFIFLSRFFSFHAGVRWHATSNQEASEIRKYFENARDIRIASNVVMPFAMKKKMLNKQSGQLKLFFLSRITRVKNLHLALQSLLLCKQGEIVFDIFGPIEDKAYWDECQQIISLMPDNIRVRSKGSVSREHLPELIGSYHFLFLPTANENFGHSIVESLQCGCPVIISNKTPWKNLESHGCGWDVEPNSQILFNLLQKAIAMNEDNYWEMQKKSISFFHSCFDFQKMKEKLLYLFQ
jgi:glycosyltransferase involved in cell wall biosynthesis